MGVLANWLGVAEAHSTHLGRTAYAAPACARNAIESCDWRALDALLSAEPPDVLVVAHGHDLTLPAPRSLAALRALFAQGIGVAVREADRSSLAIAQLWLARATFQESSA